MTMPAKVTPFPSREVLWPEDMDVISDMRDLNEVMESTRHRIRHARSNAELLRISKWCEEIAEAWQVMGDIALKTEPK